MGARPSFSTLNLLKMMTAASTVDVQAMSEVQRNPSRSEVCGFPVSVHALTKTSPGEVIYSKIGKVVPDSNHSRVFHMIETCQRLREILQTDNERSFWLQFLIEGTKQPKFL